MIWKKRTRFIFFDKFLENFTISVPNNFDPYHIPLLNYNIDRSLLLFQRDASCIRHFSSVESYLLSIEINALYKWVNIIDDMTSKKEEDGNVVTWRGKRKKEELTYLPDNLVAKDKRF